MEPRELDALVAEKAMGFSEVVRGSVDWSIDRFGPLPHYSTDRAACGQLVDKMLEGDRADLFVMFLQDYWDGPVVMCEVDRMVILAKLLQDPKKCCHAALKALGIPTEGGE